MRLRVSLFFPGCRFTQHPYSVSVIENNWANFTCRAPCEVTVTWVADNDITDNRSVHSLTGLGGERFDGMFTVDGERCAEGIREHKLSVLVNSNPPPLVQCVGICSDRPKIYSRVALLDKVAEQEELTTTRTIVPPSTASTPTTSTNTMPTTSPIAEPATEFDGGVVPHQTLRFLTLFTFVALLLMCLP